MDSLDKTQRAQRKNALKHVKKFRTCLDIGSNIGLWTSDLAQEFDKVICFEPNKKFIETFHKNIQDKNVILHNCGLSNRQHTAYQIQTSTVMLDEPGNIECKTLDSFNLRSIDFIKIDVDGFEAHVLAGALETLKNNEAVLNIEMERLKRSKVCIKVRKMLRSVGYNWVNRVRSDEVWIKS
jgi:FkbM family methyltransferase|tara:strand:+ start:694 stop:1236 length:543 start_codon:yes stop_codon:yes gene_type:complete